MMSKCSISLDINSKRKKISPFIYGNFIEHVGECIHNGIWSYDAVNVPLASNPVLDKVRKDLLQATKKLKPSVLRWPGGCYSDVYHWKDGIGPRSTRRVVENRFWGNWGANLFQGLKKISRNWFSPEESRQFCSRIGHDVGNEFGTTEFLTFCEEIKSMPLININYGSGTPEEAAEWVEYCNCHPSTRYGALRTMHGRKEPFNVPVWGIANEIYLENEQGHEKSPHAYGKRYMEFARTMKGRDPSIKLVGCGWNRGKWNEVFLKEIEEEYLNYLSIHQYLPIPTDLTQLMEAHHPDNETVYYTMMASPFEIKKQILKAWNNIVSVLGEQTHVRVALDEWGIWYTINDIIKTNYNLKDGVCTALMLMLFQKLSDICPISLWSMMVNSLGMIRTDKEGLVLTPVYLAFQLFTNHTYNNLLENIQVETDTFYSESYGQVNEQSATPLVECSATCSDDGNRASLVFVNKHFSESITVNLTIESFAFFRVGKIFELTGDSPFDYNTIEKRDRIKIKEKDIGDVGPEMKIKLQPHSVTVLKLLKLNLGISI